MQSDGWTARFVLCAMMCLMLSWAPSSRAATTPKFSPCLPADFLLPYEDRESVALSADQAAMVDIVVARALQCDIRRIEVFSTSPSPADPIWQRRVEVMREALVARGIDEQLIEIRTNNAALPEWLGDPPREGIVGLVHYR